MALRLPVPQGHLAPGSSPGSLFGSEGPSGPRVPQRFQPWPPLSTGEPEVPWGNLGPPLNCGTQVHGVLYYPSRLRTGPMDLFCPRIDPFTSVFLVTQRTTYHLTDLNVW